jgi:hypothetical protein
MSAVSFSSMAATSSGFVDMTLLLVESSTSIVPVVDGIFTTFDGNARVLEEWKKFSFYLAYFSCYISLAV